MNVVVSCHINTLYSKISKYHQEEMRDYQSFTCILWLMPASQMWTHRNDSSSCAHGANVQHENFSFAQLLYLSLFLTTLHAMV